MSVNQSKRIRVGGFNGTIHVESFESAYEMADSCKTRKMTSKMFHDMPKHDIDKSWHGVESYAEALNMLKTGYQPSVGKLGDAMKAEVSGTKKRFSFTNDVVGFAPIVPLVLTGVPNCYSNMTIRQMKTKVIDVYYDMTANCGYRPDDFLRAGENLLREIVAGEKQGYRFNLYAVQSYCDNDSCDMVVIKIKSSGQPLDLKRVSFPLTHPAFFRVIGFDWYSKTPGGKYRGGYGTSLARCCNDVSGAAKMLFGKNAIYIPCADIINGMNVKEVLKNACNDNKR